MHTNKHEGGFTAIAVIAVVVVGSIIAGIIISSDKTEPVAPEGFLDEQVAETEVMEDKMMDDDMNDDHRDGDGDMDDKMMDDGVDGDESSMKDDMTDEDMGADTMKKEPIVSEIDMDVSMKPGTYAPYSADKLALAADGDVVLFFHAGWCPSCRGLENDINNNLANIPAGTHILKVDYDTETELKKKYGIVRQHTLVQVDQNGAALQTLTGLTNTLAQVAAQL